MNSELGREYQRAVMELFDGYLSRFLQGPMRATNNLSDASQSPIRGVSPRLAKHEAKVLPTCPRLSAGNLFVPQIHSSRHNYMNILTKGLKVITLSNSVV